MSREDSNAERFAEIVCAYQQELRRFLSQYMSNQADVDDCAQETLLNIWRQQQRGLLREETRGYVFITAMNVMRDFWRRNRVRRKKDHVELSVELAEMRSTSTGRRVAEREGIRLIEAQLDKLKPSTKAVFLLYHVENLTFQQIAVRLGMSVRTVEREMARALEFCRSTLGGVVGDFLED